LSNSFRAIGLPGQKRNPPLRASAPVFGAALSDSFRDIGLREHKRNPPSRASACLARPCWNRLRFRHDCERRSCYVKSSYRGLPCCAPTIAGQGRGKAFGAKFVLYVLFIRLCAYRLAQRSISDSHFQGWVSVVNPPITLSSRKGEASGGGFLVPTQAPHRRLRPYIHICLLCCLRGRLTPLDGGRPATRMVGCAQAPEGRYPCRYRSTHPTAALFYGFFTGYGPYPCHFIILLGFPL
jgi:hypothetical protein